MSTPSHWEARLEADRKKWLKTNSSQDYEAYAITCVLYLCSDFFTARNEHWFCGSEHTRHISTTSLVVFSFDITTADDMVKTRYRDYETRFTEMLASCSRCGVAYQCCLESYIENELIKEVGIKRDAALAFLKTIRVNDRLRLSKQLTLKPVPVPVLTETLWSDGCMGLWTFVHNNLEATNILENKELLGKVGCCPGLLSMVLYSNPKYRQIGWNQLKGGKGRVDEYAEAWKHSDRRTIFIRMFAVSLKRSINAQDRADLTWLNLGKFVAAFAKHREILSSIMGLAIEGFKGSQITPGLGAHYLLLQFILSGENTDALMDVIIGKNKVDLSQYESCDISENVINEWFQLYVKQNDVDIKRLFTLCEFMMNNVPNSAPSVLRVISTHKREMYLPLMKKDPKYFEKNLLSGTCSDVQDLWLYQISQPQPQPQPNTSPKEADSYSIWKHVLLNNRDPKLLVMFLQVAIAIVSPETNPSEGISYEPLLKEMLERFSDLVDSKSLAAVLDDSGALKTLLMFCARHDGALSLASEEFIKQALEDEGGESTVALLLKHNAQATIEVVNSILVEAAQAQASSIPLMAGIINMATLMLDQVYSIRDGVDTTSNTEILKGLQAFWNNSWDIIDNIIKNIRAWSQKHNVVQVLTNSLEFGQELLAKFRLLDADLSAGIPLETSSWGEKLAEPAIACINNMGDMLRLNHTNLLAMALSIIIEILGLMQSFDVGIPDTLKELFQGLATGVRSSRLTESQIRDLMSACKVSQSDITQLLQKRTEAQNRLKKTSQGASLSQSSQGSQIPLTQKSISDYFKSFNGQRLPPPPQRNVVNNSYVPRTIPQSTALGAIRAQLMQSQSHSNSKLPPLNKYGVIHPERPPGFNVKRPVSSSPPSVSSSDDDDDDDSGGALAVLSGKHDEEAIAKLREAYNKPKTGPQIIQLAGVTDIQRQKSQREQEEQMMKKRLMVTAMDMYREVLTWDYYTDENPVKSNISIPNVFNDTKQYQSVMSPLLFLEAWEQIQQKKIDFQRNKPTTFSMVFGKRVKIDDFVVVYASMSKSSFVEASLMEGDIILVSYDPSRPGEFIEPTSGLPHALGRIKEGSIKYYNKPSSGSGSGDKSYFVDLQVRLMDNPRLLSPLGVGAVVSAFSMGSVRTLEREYISLMAIPYYDLVDDILKAKPAISNDNHAEIQAICQKQNLNMSQATAVSRSLHNSGISLIQGPPGTGKTKTILSIIGAYFSSNQMVRDANGGDVSENKRILVCAPSNAAVDEIVLRLKNGVPSTNGTTKNLNILRLGRVDAISEQVHDVCLENLIAKELNTSADVADSSLRQEHTTLIKRRNEVREKMQSQTLPPEELHKLEGEMRSIQSQIRDKRYALDMQRERLEQARKQKDANFRKQQQEIVSKAQVVCTTLSASAHPVLQSMSMKFETVIIDEAAQCIELSALIPLKYGCKRCIMVGDPNQLPPTVISQRATQLKYNQSLFVRMFDQWKDVPGSVCMLDTQFRMHPDISRFPSNQFYKGKLKDGPDLSVKCARPWHKSFPALGPYMFFDVAGQQERAGNLSLRNIEEARAALQLVQYLLKNYPDPGSIGVITPYKEQVRYLKKVFIEAEGPDIMSLVDFNTIDGFQGQEKDVIIMSCVRAESDEKSGIGFLGDVRRLNVAITRAKASMWILGNSRSLSCNSIWRSLITDASDRGKILQVKGNIAKSIAAFKPSSVSGSLKPHSSIEGLVPATTSIQPVSAASQEDEYTHKMPINHTVYSDKRHFVDDTSSFPSKKTETETPYNMPKNSVRVDHRQRQKKSPNIFITKRKGRPQK